MAPANEARTGRRIRPKRDRLWTAWVLCKASGIREATVWRLMGHPVGRPLASPEAIHWPISARTAPRLDTPWLRIRSFLNACSGLFAAARGGRAQTGALGAGGQPHGKGNAVDRR